MGIAWHSEAYLVVHMSMLAFEFNRSERTAAMAIFSATCYVHCFPLKQLELHDRQAHIFGLTHKNARSLKIQMHPRTHTLAPTDTDTAVYVQTHIGKHPHQRIKEEIYKQTSSQTINRHTYKLTRKRKQRCAHIHEKASKRLTRKHADALEHTGKRAYSHADRKTNARIHTHMQTYWCSQFTAISPTTSNSLATADFIGLSTFPLPGRGAPMRPHGFSYLCDECF